MEAPVGARRVSLAREHACGHLAISLEREDARGEGEPPGQVLRAEVAHERPCRSVSWHSQAADARAGQGRAPGTGVLPQGGRIRGPVPQPLGHVGEQATGALRPRRHEFGQSGDRVRGIEGGDLVGQGSLVEGGAVVVADGLGDLGEVAHPVGGHGARTRGGQP